MAKKKTDKKTEVINEIVEEVEDVRDVKDVKATDQMAEDRADEVPVVVEENVKEKPESAETFDEVISETADEPAETAFETVDSAVEGKEELSLEEQLKAARVEKERLEKEVAKKAALERKYQRKKKRTEFFNKPLTRKFVIASLAIALLANLALTGSVLALTSKINHRDKAVKSEEYGYRQDMPNDNFDDRQRNYQPFDDQYGGGSDNGQFNNQYGDQDDSYNYWFGGGDSDNQNNENNNIGNNQSQGNNNNKSKASIGIVISENSGIYVAQVTGENAKSAGFKEGDKIVSFEGKNISNSNDLISAVQSHNAGDSVAVTVERDGQKVEIKTTLE